MFKGKEIQLLEPTFISFVFIFEQPIVLAELRR